MSAPMIFRNKRAGRRDSTGHLTHFESNFLPRGVLKRLSYKCLDNQVEEQVRSATSVP